MSEEVKKVKHTPGPWIARRFPTGRNAISEQWVMDATPDGPDGRVVANVIAKCLSTNRDCEANASIIAAAPDLLAACEYLVGDLQERIENGARFNPGTIHAIDQATAAIAKAKGE